MSVGPREHTLRQRYVLELENLGAIRSPRVRDAFATIPRHVFLPCYYIWQDFEWRKYCAPGPESVPEAIEAWLATIYVNRTRTTQVTAYLPISSSSQPSLMAHMLEALQMEPGMRVLEIGTGTGYNAGLLVHLAGAPTLVTTIDINAHLIQQARQIIDELVGPGLEAWVGDGFQGVAQRSPFDRIIATARVSTLPDAWIEQLAPGGRVVMDLGGQLAGGLLMAQKLPDGSISGAFLPVNVSFMTMQSPACPSPSLSFQALAQRHPDHILSVDASEFSPLVFRERDFRFFLQWRCPGAALEWWGKEHESLLPTFGDQESLLMFDPDQSGWRVQIRGPVSLWQQVFQAYQDWKQSGCPSLSDYTLIVSKKPYQKQLLVSSKGKPGVRSSFLLA